MLSGPTNLQCPACSHVFMSVQSRGDGHETCPHCAFVGSRNHFRALSQPMTAQPVRFQKRVPRLQQESPPQAPFPSLPPQMPMQLPPQMQAQPQYSQHACFPPPSQPPIANPPVSAPHTSPVQHAHWPGLGATNTPDSSPAPWQPPEQPAITPRKKSRVGFWLTLSAVSAATFGITCLLAREKIRLRINNLRAAQVTHPSAKPRSLPTLGSKVDPLEQMNQRVLTSDAMTDAEALVRTLFNSTSTEQRLQAVAEPEKYAKEVAAMFDGSSPRPSLIMLTPITNPPLSLVTQERMPMFRVTTTANKAGALLSLTPGANGARRISWPLFHETHDRLLPLHIQAKDRNPKWFHVGLRRFHSFELPEPARSEFDAIDIDGSTDGSGRIVTFVAKESPLGRQFANALEWETFYFGRVLVSWMDIAGELRPALLDYEGSILPAKKTAAPAPAN